MSSHQVQSNHARNHGYQAKNSVEIANRYKLGISDNRPYIAPQPVNQVVSSSSIKETKNYYQKGGRPCHNCSDKYDRDPIYYQPWHQKIEPPSIDNAPHRSGNIYTPKVFQ